MTEDSPNPSVQGGRRVGRSVQNWGPALRGFGRVRVCADWASTAQDRPTLRRWNAGDTTGYAKATNGNAQSMNHCIAPVGCGGMHTSHDTQVPHDWRTGTPKPNQVHRTTFSDAAAFTANANVMNTSHARVGGTQQVLIQNTRATVPTHTQC